MNTRSTIYTVTNLGILFPNVTKRPGKVAKMRLLTLIESAINKGATGDIFLYLELLREQVIQSECNEADLPLIKKHLDKLVTLCENY